MTYWYRDHLKGAKKTTERVSRGTFIGRMVQHILPKGFQRIRYYGLQATCLLKKLRAQLMTALHVAVQQVIDLGDVPLTRPRYRERMLSAFGHDPLVCRRCGVDMWLWQIWHPQYGVISDELERRNRGCMSELDDPFAEELTPTERETLGLDQTVTYRYRCSHCRQKMRCRMW